MPGPVRAFAAGPIAAVMSRGGDHESPLSCDVSTALPATQLPVQPCLCVATSISSEPSARTTASGLPTQYVSLPAAMLSASHVIRPSQLTASQLYRKLP